MNNLGRLFRDIRISKNYSLKEVSEGIMSISLLSKFERGESEISLTKFYLLLDRLSINLEEFSFIANDFRPTKFEVLMSNVRTAYENNNLSYLLKLEKEERLKWEKYGFLKFKYNSIVIKALAIDLNGKLAIDDDDINVLSEYLFSVENWGYYEMIIFGNSMTLLNNESVISLSKEILNRTQLYTGIKKYKEDLIRILLNTITFSLEKQKLADAFRFILVVEKIIENTDLYFEKVKLLYLKGIYKIEIGEKNQGIELAKRAIEIMQYLDDNNSANNHEEFLNNKIKISV